MYEAELKAIVKDKEAVLRELHILNPAPLDSFTYQDYYFDSGDNLQNKEQELRLRVKTDCKSGKQKTILTFKDVPFDKQSKSKPEFETQVTDFQNTVAILEKLGFRQTLAYTKNCELIKLQFGNQQLEVTLVEIPGLDPVFIEVECLTENLQDTPVLLKMLEDFLKKLNIPKELVTTDYYVDLIRQQNKL